MGFGEICRLGNEGFGKWEFGLKVCLGNRVRGQAQNVCCKGAPGGRFGDFLVNHGGECLPREQNEPQGGLELTWYWDGLGFVLGRGL